MNVTWIGHASFMLESDGYRVVIDPYGGVPGLADSCVSAHAVYCSHGHFDHANTQAVTLLEERACPFTVTEIPTFHDDREGRLRGENTVRCFCAEGLRLVHLGDLGHPLSEKQLEAIGRCDVLMVPVGGTYTVDAQGAKAVCDAVGAKIVIPMHYRQGAMGFENIATVEEFTALLPPDTVQVYDGACLAVDSDTPAQTAVLRPQNLL